MFNICKEIQRFCQSTSLKGVPRILRTGSLSLRCMWATAVLAFLCVAGLQSYDIVCEYLTYPTVTVVREKGLNLFRDGEKLMPHILVCNLNPFAYSTMDRSGEIPSLQEFHTLVMRLTACNNCSTERKYFLLQTRQELLTYTGYYQYIDRKNIHRISHRKDHFIVSCQVNILDGLSIGKRSCHEEVHIEHVMNSVYYNCFSLSIAKQSIQKMVVGITVTLFLDNFDIQDKYTSYLNVAEESGQAQGALVTLTRPGAFPLIRRNGILLSPGTLTDIKFNIEHRKRLPKPHGECSDEPSIPGWQNAMNTSTHTYEGCLSFCAELYVEKQCGCIDTQSLNIRYGKNPRLPLCGSIHNPGEFFQRFACAKANRTIGLFYDCVHKCTIPCSDILYKFRTSVAKWPGMPVSTTFYKDLIIGEPFEWRFPEAHNWSDIDMDTMEASHKIQQNFLRFTVQLAENRYIELSDEARMTLPSLVSQLGGGLNLWSGITMVVIVEFVEFFLRLLSPKELETKTVSVNANGSMSK